MKKKTLVAALLFVLSAVGGILLWFLYPQEPYPIDLVYLWVDGSDENWMKKKEYWKRQDDPNWLYATSEARWRDRDELRHSLRSVEAYLPWVRRIYIVTDNQVPRWLNTDHPKIRIVDHKDIFPKEALPVFNSMAIEARLPYISGLAEHFIYLNDDMFVNAPLTRDFFFDSSGRPILYIDARWTEIYKKIVSERPNDPWSKLVMRSYRIFEKKTGTALDVLVDTHTASAYLKSDYLGALKFFEAEMKPTVYSKFRSPEDLGRDLVSMYSFMKGHLVIKDGFAVDRQFSCAPAGLLVMTNMDDLSRYESCLFCLNDTQDLPEEYNQAHINYLKMHFRQKSSFEK